MTLKLTFTEDKRILPYPEVGFPVSGVDKSNLTKRILALGIWELIGITFIVLGTLNLAGLNAVSGSGVGVSVCVVGIIAGVFDWGMRKKKQKDAAEIDKQRQENYKFAVMCATTIPGVCKAITGVMNFANQEIILVNVIGVENLVKKVKYSGDLTEINKVDENNILGTIVNPAFKSLDSPCAYNNHFLRFSHQQDYSDVIKETNENFEMRFLPGNAYDTSLKNVMAYLSQGKV